MNAGRISIAYAGVHTAYQLALGVQERGELSEFSCALYDDPRKLGGRFGGFVGTGLMEGRRAEGLDLRRVVEFPWPLLAKVARDRVYRRGRGQWLGANAAFDAWAARRLRRSPPALFVGTSTSALHSLNAARRVGAIAVLDCPAAHPWFEAELMREAAERAGMPLQRGRRWWRRYDMNSRKLDEYAQADHLSLYSEFHRKGFAAQGFDPARCLVTPLWADPLLWHRGTEEGRVAPDAPLRLLFAGTISLRKGIPFLLDAVDRCGAAVELTLAGPRDPHLPRMFDRERPNVHWVGAQPKPRLRALYAAHDVLVLPSVVDSFGYVALEAMACGLPVIVSGNCGVQLPDPDWAVPAMDPAALARRIMLYADDRMLVAEHGRAASAFAAGFTPERYRRDMAAKLVTLLDGSTPP